MEILNHYSHGHCHTTHLSHTLYGIEKVIELDLKTDEKELLEESRKHVKEVMSVLENLK